MKKLFLKEKIINIFMQSGKKKIVEKSILKFVKTLLKFNNKKFETLFNFFIINTTPVFLVHTRILKKGKKKVIRNVPSFLLNDFVRVKSSMKTFKNFIAKEKKSSFFHKMLAKESLNSFHKNSGFITKKIDEQKKILLNKRYWSSFKW